MTSRPRLFADILPRPALVRVATGFLLAISAAMLAAPAAATLLPPGFFDMQVTPGAGAAAVEADMLSFDARTSVITASGNVLLSYQGMTIRADRLEFNQRTGELDAVGAVAVKDSSGNIFEMDTVEVTGGMKDAFIKSLTITTSAGAIVTADSVEYHDTLATILTEASYSPCGLCIDSKGRKIGWKVKSARMIYDRDRASVTLEQPSVEFLGVPVAWLPWFWVPDPTQPRAQGLRMPNVDYSETRGAELTVPYFVPVSEDIDLVLSPTLMSRQGFLASGELTWRLPEWGGVIEVKASGLYQLDRSAFAGQQGDRDWRGAIQTAGRFVPAENWKAGWSYSVFSDNAYLSDYELTDANSSVNQVYTTHLNQQTWFDARIQRFNRIGNVAPDDDQRQGMNLPRIEFEHVHDLAPGWGRLHLNGTLLGVRRGLDQTATYAGVPYVFGNEGTKLHGMLEGAWENQIVLPGGVTATPYLGARLDGATYDRTAAALPAPYPTQIDATLLSATPIAALDVRWPLMANWGADTHLIEPIAQIVYRGSGVTRTGITNDDAHSFVFDTSNLFSYNRFSGIDRQETGLRANVGGHYLGTFADGSWLDLVAGQSFHLAGVNAYGISDEVQVGTSTGLGMPSSFIVGSARAGTAWGLSGGAKVQIDPAAWRITRAGVGADYAPPGLWFTLGADYIYLAADPALGIVDEEHEITGRATVKIDDYYNLSGGLTWNIDDSTWIRARTGLVYDDGYLALGGGVYWTPTSWGIDFFRLNIKGPDGSLAF
jgi:LPS-assembly protein